MNLKLAKFSDLVPSKLPFVEGKLEGHKNRKIRKRERIQSSP